ncbi:hypothetical protein LCGC14_2893860, partial [marine sediment metagenome]
MILGKKHIFLDLSEIRPPDSPERERWRADFTPVPS